MSTILRPVGHEDKLSLVEHLDELRTRLLVGIGAFFVCFALCFWQNATILDIANAPLRATAGTGERTDDPLEQAGRFQQRLRDLAASQAALSRALARDPDVSAAVRAAAAAAAAAGAEAVRSAPTDFTRGPITTGVGEPFFATFKVAMYAALLLSLPILLWQVYAFILPAFSPHERRMALPLMTLVPFLFYAGVLFAYLVVLPSAIDFLQNFNDDQFDILIQAKDLYRFTMLVCIAMGMLFQIPVAILLLTRMEILSVAQLRTHRRYAILVIAVLAMFLPGTDPVTMLLAMAPLVVLYEGSIVLAALLERRAARASELEPADPDDD